MDISFLTKYDIEAIKKTIAHYLSSRAVSCPGDFYAGWPCYKCRRLFPKTKREEFIDCPCHVHTKKYVIKRARYFVKLWEDERGIGGV